MSNLVPQRGIYPRVTKQTMKTTYTLIQVQNQKLTFTSITSVTKGLEINNKHGKAQKANFICPIWAIIAKDGTVLCGS